MAGQIWAVNSLGGYMYADNLSDEFREALQPAVKFRQFCDVKDAAEKNRGQTFNWDIFANVSSQGGTLVETNTMPETNFTVLQGTLTVTEYGNSVPYSGKLEALAKLSVRKPLMRALKNDAKKVFDTEAHAQFNACKLRVIASSGTDTGLVQLYTNGTVTGTNSIAFTKDHAKSIVDVMKERNIPPYIDDDYYAIAWPTTLRRLKNDLESIHQYTAEGFRLIMNGEIGRYENTRYVEQTNVGKGVSNDGTAWTNAKSDWIFFCGEDTVAEGIVIPEEMRAKIPGDYGRSKGVAWYYLGGFGIVHTNATESRIVKWDSAA